MKTLNYYINYDTPNKYLLQGEQASFIFGETEFKELKQKIGNIKIDKDLFKIIDFIHENKIGNVINNDKKFRRSAKKIFESKEYAGCTDFALVFAAIARQFGFPSVCVETADLDWIKEVEFGKTLGARGHSTCEVFIDNKWVHVYPIDKFIDGCYDRDSDIITYRKKEQRYVFWKGIDLFEIGINTTTKMVDLMQNLVLEDLKEKNKNRDF